MIQTSVSGTAEARDPSAHRPQERPRNLGEFERLLSKAVGGGLILYGLSRRTLMGRAGLLAGAGFVYRGWTGHCPLYQRLGLNTADVRHSAAGVRAQHGTRVTCSVHVNRDRHEVYRTWRDLPRLPTIMRHLVSVTPIDEKRSRWVARAPMDKTLEWDAEIITDKPGEVIAWQSLPGSQVDTAGSVHFRTPAFGEGTEVSVSLKYDPPGGAAIAKAADLFGQGLQSEVQQDLRTFKQLMETGEVATARPQPTGRRGP